MKRLRDARTVVASRPGVIMGRSNCRRPLWSLRFGDSSNYYPPHWLRPCKHVSFLFFAAIFRSAILDVDRFDPGLAFWRSFLDTLRRVVFDSLVATGSPFWLSESQTSGAFRLTSGIAVRLIVVAELFGSKILDEDRV